jgi:hypothetical protein
LLEEWDITVDDPLLQWRVIHRSNHSAVLCQRGGVLRPGRFMGTWKLNEAKSKLSSGAPKNSTVVYEAAGENVKVAGRDVTRTTKMVLRPA